MRNILLCRAKGHEIVFVALPIHYVYVTNNRPATSGVSAAQSVNRNRRPGTIAKKTAACQGKQVRKIMPFQESGGWRAVHG